MLAITLHEFPKVENYVYIFRLNVTYQIYIYDMYSQLENPSFHALFCIVYEQI